MKPARMAGIVGTSTVVAIAISVILVSMMPQKVFGTKQEVVSYLAEYFSRESTGVTLQNERTTQNEDGLTIHTYDLIAKQDSQPHGFMALSVRESQVNVIGVTWTHEGKDDLLASAGLISSGIVDLTIPEWRDKDDLENRNMEFINWIGANFGDSEETNSKDFESRTLTLTRDPYYFFQLTVSKK
jgi:hypothetical protein